MEAVGAAFQQVYKVNVSIRPNHDLENRALLNHFYLRNDITHWRSENRGFMRFNDDSSANAIIAEQTGPSSLLVKKVELQLIFNSIKNKKSAGGDGTLPITRMRPHIFQPIFGPIPVGICLTRKILLHESRYIFS